MEAKKKSKILKCSKKNNHLTRIIALCKISPLILISTLKISNKHTFIIRINPIKMIKEKMTKENGLNESD